MKQIQEWLTMLVGDGRLWIISVFVIVTITLIAAFFFRLVLKKVQAKASLTKTVWDDALISALLRPMTWMIWLFGVCYAADVANTNLDEDLSQFIVNFKILGINVLVTWFLVLFIKRSEDNLVDPEFTKNKPMDVTTVTAIGKLLRISVIITAVLVALQAFGYSVSGVLALGGIGGIAVSLAAKDLLANLFGGLMLFLDRQFAVGDWVRSPDQNIEGTVEDIGWRLTRIRTFDKRPLYVPNSTFTTISVENPSRMENRRIYETIGVRYDDAAKLPAIVEEVKKMLRAHPELDMEQTLIVNFNAFASSSLDFFVYTFTKTTNWVEFHEIKQDVLFKILNIIESQGAECAFPTSTLHVPDGLAIDVNKADKLSPEITE